MTEADLVDRISRAIATMEGFHTKGSRAQLNNNPGNLRSWGSFPRVEGFVHFPTVERGWHALRTQIRRNIARGLSLYEFFGGKAGSYPGYAPSKDRNNPEKYARYAAGIVGINPATPLNSTEILG